MPVYPQHVANAIREPRYCRSLDIPTAAGSDANFDCGCYVRFELQIETSELTVSEAGYRTNGCGYLVAAAEDLSKRIHGRSLRDLHDELTAECHGRSTCSTTSLNALKRALAEFRSRQIEEFRGEKALICTCFGVEEETIEQRVKRDRLTDLQSVSDATRAGSGCGSCLPLIQEILDAHK